VGALPVDTAYWLERVETAGVPAAPILTYDRVYANPQARALGLTYPALTEAMTRA